jgi:DNA-binding NarL/FixJ family response regulator
MPGRRAVGPQRIRIVIVEEYDLVRATLRAIVGRAPDLSIAAEVATIDGAIEFLREDPADVVLVDAQVALVNVVPALQHLKREFPRSPIVLVGRRGDDDEVFQAIQAGVAAYVVDTVRGARLLKTIRGAAAGKHAIDASVAARPVVARRVLEAFGDAALPTPGADTDASRPSFEVLSDRETEILTKMSQGMTNNDIAVALSISRHTVSNDVSAVLRKLAANNRTHAVLIALGHRLISLSDRPRGRLN